MHKKCTACGVDKPIEDFRKYYHRQKGHYPYCKECESIEGRRKYLVGRGDALTEVQREELSNIERLYDVRQAAGLRVPGRKRPARPSVASLVNKYLKETP